ncbi:putative receptor-like protein kinase At3g47110 [Benincasa hispida]|uniref:putative receptor-like protein kinase At3g47110 n=1 Tax=Benincasa hispida TaxID=102211 RepID=UPI00190250D1|nr:putative receptor-like protein kinase At3g47110 [Benincasa hispida]
MGYNFCNTKRKILNNIFLLSLVLTFASILSSADESDRFALLDLKDRVLNDPLKITSSWNDSTHFCDWIGVICNSTNRRVVGLDLEARNLTGSLPSSLGNLTYLVEVRLGDNNFHGRIPQEFGLLLQLRYLNLSHNNFGGEIPTNISHCTQLVVLAMNSNGLVGQIPHQLFTLTKLSQLRFDLNNLTGLIPSWTGNFSSLLHLDFKQNNFEGNIPSELGRLSRLKFFSVALNYLTGTVPLSIYNITSLTYMTVAANKLQGTLPPNIGITLPNIQRFLGGHNYFRGPIPKSFVNASDLRMLDIAENNLTGTIPDGLGSLKNLEILNFPSNNLGNGKVGDLDFINSLANSNGSRLWYLGLGRNRFGGALPPSIGNLSNLITLYIGQNMLTGSIPDEIGNLINLQVLIMEYNHLNGRIPPNIGKLQKLAMVYLGQNDLTGPIPSSLGNLSSTIKLYLFHNRLEGSIPPSLGRCRSLQALDLSGNNLTGSIPKEIFGISSLTIYLDLSRNSLTGPLPSEVGELVNLAELGVSMNKLSGNIPNNLDKCISIQSLYFQGNQFTGIIPPSLEALKGLQNLDLSSNNLSGPIPQFLGKLLSLNYLNLSYNNFEGKVPSVGVFSNSTMISIIGNKNLCDGLPELHLPPCKYDETRLPKKRFAVSKVLIIIVPSVTLIAVLVSIFFVCFMLKKSKKNSSTSSSAKELLPQISYLELSRSTNRFSTDNLIGSGSFGYVYKGVLPNDGSIVAIKVLNLQQQGASKSFVDECNALSNIRHRNLLKIITSCSSIDVQGNEFKALVFNFMSNGNLDGWLHPDQGNNRRRLSFIQRLNIAIDIASGLDYLHNHCETPIVHCDLKPSNILLDDNMVAHVGDFGIARFMLEGSDDQIPFSQTMSLALKGSIGYIPPEYGIGNRISIEGDIFSYGILLIEMITGKRPTNDMFSNGMDIHLFTTMALRQDAWGIIDPYILFEEIHREEGTGEEIQEIAKLSKEHRRKIMPRWMEECLISIMKIGLSCSMRTPSERTLSMNVVVNELLAIKRSCVKRRFHRHFFPQA